MPFQLQLIATGVTSDLFVIAGMTSTLYRNHTAQSISTKQHKYAVFFQRIENATRLPYWYSLKISVDIDTTLAEFVHRAVAVSICQTFQSLQDDSPTNQLAVSQVADWITRGPVNSSTAIF